MYSDRILCDKILHSKRLKIAGKN